MKKVGVRYRTEFFRQDEGSKEKQTCNNDLSLVWFIYFKHINNTR